MDRLLAESSLQAERALHVARGVLWIVLTFVILRLWGPALDLWLPVAVSLGSVAVWYLLWRYLQRNVYRPWLKYVTIALDVVVVARLIPAYALRDQVDLGAAGTITVADVDALVPLGMALVIVSAAMRLSPRAVVYATVCAVASIVLGALLLKPNLGVSIPQGTLLALAGAMTASATGRLRDTVLRARREEVLEGYVPTALIDELARAEDPRTLGREEEVTILFADIRGYTTLVEPLTAAETLAFLNDYFAAVVAPIVANRGAIDKYIGDGLLAFFEGEDHAPRAVETGRAMLAAVADLNGRRAGRPPVRVGIAIHSGPVLIGTVGAPPRREYTVLGDTVNVASRLEELNKAFGTALLVSGTTRALAGNVGELRRTDAVPIRGRVEPLDVFALG